MANFYYVKSGGSATGDAGRVATTKSTGSFATKGAAACYNDVVAALAATTPPVSGDFIMVSNVHNHNYAANVAYALPDGVTVVSVDDSNCEDELAGAAERATGGAYKIDFMSSTTSTEGYFRGITFEADREMRPSTGTDQKVIFVNCEFINNAGVISEFMQLSTTVESYIRFIDCNFKFGHVNQWIVSKAHSKSYYENCTIDAGGSAVDQFIKCANDAGSSVEIVDSDFTGMGATPSIIDAQGTFSGVQLKMHNCLVPASTTWVNGSQQEVRASEIHLTSIGVGTAVDDYHYYHDSEIYLGTAEEDTTIYRTAGADYDGTNGFSTKVVTESTASFVDPQKVLLRTMYIDTSLYTTNVTFKVHFSRDGSAVALNSDEVWMRAVHVDGNEQALGVGVTTEPALFETGTAPTTETSLWTGLGGTNKQMSINTGTITIGTGAGNIASGVVKIYAYIAVPSLTIYIDPDVVVS